MPTRREVVKMLIADAESDAEALDTLPFTPKGVGEAFGNTLALVHALARIVDDLLRERGE